MAQLSQLVQSINLLASRFSEHSAKMIGYGRGRESGWTYIGGFNNVLYDLVGCLR